MGYYYLDPKDKDLLFLGTLFNSRSPSSEDILKFLDSS